MVILVKWLVKTICLKQAFLVLSETKHQIFLICLNEIWYDFLRNPCNKHNEQLGCYTTPTLKNYPKDVAQFAQPFLKGYFNQSNTYYASYLEMI